MNGKDEKIFKCNVPGDLKERLDEVLAATDLSLTAYTIRMTEWWLSLDDVMRAMIVRQVEPAPDLVELVLRRLNGSKPPREPRIGVLRKER